MLTTLQRPAGHRLACTLSRRVPRALRSNQMTTTSSRWRPELHVTVEDRHPLQGGRRLSLRLIDGRRRCDSSIGYIVCNPCSLPSKRPISEAELRLVCL